MGGQPEYDFAPTRGERVMFSTGCLVSQNTGRSGLIKVRSGSVKAKSTNERDRTAPHPLP
jgi:hypothetical protein